jgi:hypothetical protein
MHWYRYLAYSLGGAFRANRLPRIGNRISGLPFPIPFRKPPGRGLSSSTAKVLRGLFNRALQYLLIVRVSSFGPLDSAHLRTLGAAALIMSVTPARGFGRFQGGL